MAFNLIITKQAYFDFTFNFIFVIKQACFDFSFNFIIIIMQVHLDFAFGFKVIIVEEYLDSINVNFRFMIKAIITALISSDFIFVLKVADLYFKYLDFIFNFKIKYLGSILVILVVLVIFVVFIISPKFVAMLKQTFLINFEIDVAIILVIDLTYSFLMIIFS